MSDDLRGEECVPRVRLQALKRPQNAEEEVQHGLLASGCDRLRRARGPDQLPLHRDVVSVSVSVFVVTVLLRVYVFSCGGSVSGSSGGGMSCFRAMRVEN